MGNYSVSAATVTVNERGQILMLRRADNNEWQIPGGVVDSGEQPPEAAIRETMEETGIQVELDRCTGVYTNVRRDICAFVFLAKPIGGTPTISSESVEVRWVPRDEAWKLTSEVFRPRIVDALRLSGRIMFRAHDGSTIIR